MGLEKCWWLWRGSGPEMSWRGTACLVLLALAAVYLPWAWSDQLGSLGGDSAVYVLTSRHFAPGLAHDPVAQAMAEASLFPPLYPLVLALSGGAAELHWAHAATTVCLLAAFALFHAWQRQLGLAAPLALAGLLLFALLPGTWLLALQLLSEPLYLLLSLAFLLTASGTDPGPRQAWAAAILLAALLLTRTAGVAMVPAYLWLLLRRRPARWPAMLVLALAPAPIWFALHPGEEAYRDSLADSYVGDGLATGFARLIDNTMAMGGGLAMNVVQTPVLLLAVLALGLPALAVAVRRLVEGKADAIYLWGYLAMIAIWPYPAEARRLAWVLMPLLIAYLLLAGEALADALRAHGLAAARLAAGLPALLSGLVLLPGDLQAALRYQSAASVERPEVRHLPEWYEPDPRMALRQATLHLDLADALGRLGRLIPPGECVFSIKPQTVAWYTRRDSYVTPFEALDDAPFERWLADKGCGYVLMMAATTEMHPTPYFPAARIPERLEPIETISSLHDGQQTDIAGLARLQPSSRRLRPR